MTDSSGSTARHPNTLGHWAGIRAGRARNERPLSLAISHPCPESGVTFGGFDLGGVPSLAQAIATRMRFG